MSLIKTEPLEDLVASFQSDSLLNLTYSGNNSQVEEEQRVNQHDTNTKMCATVKIEQDKYESVLLNLLNPGTSTFFTNLYEDHQIKEEMVIGPTILQDNSSGVNCNDMCATVKIEQDEHIEPNLDSESELLKLVKPSTSTFHTSLYEDHQIKEDIVIGPTILQDNYSGANCIGAIEESTKQKANITTIRHKVKEKKRVKCICSKTFTDSSNLRRHIKRFHIDNIKKSTKKKFKKESEAYSNKENCNVSIDFSINSFENHKFPEGLKTTDDSLTFDSNKNWRDSEINETKTSFVKHTQVHTQSQVNIKICENINDKIERRSMTAQKGKEDHKCNICFKTFTLIANLKRHIQQFHVGKYRFECNMCDKTFERKDYLVQHNKAMHSGQTKLGIYICFCGNKYAAKSSYLRHKNRCNKNNKTCDICLKEFYNSSKYRRHLRNHNTSNKRVPRPICNCDFCGKAFDKKDRLVRHIHTNHMAVTLPHKCEICNKQYALKQSYKKHVSSHSKSRKPKNKGRQNGKCRSSCE